jgi:MoaA/NifB/PqqE/SkfB family radical SAM enzyme
MNLTLSLSFRCNSTCKTCNIYKKKADEFSLEEWKKLFQNLGSKDVFWVTISGGEPFLRKDLEQVVCALYDICSPSIINIPTNGILSDRIPQLTRNIAAHCKNAHIVVNVSIDEIGDKHDEIRSVPGNYDKAVETVSALKALRMPNLSVGIHTVISKFNVTRIPEIYMHLRSLEPDSYITEIAEERVELDTIGADITPAYEDYARAVDFLIKKLKYERFDEVGRIARAFRIEYYRLVKRILTERRQVIPCYSGFASAQVAPDGDVWMCCIKAKSIGNLRDVDYDFNKVWFSEESDVLRRSIKRGECYCPLANAGYTNMLHRMRSLFKAGLNLLSRQP